jgi:hypothetical protein
MTVRVICLLALLAISGTGFAANSPAERQRIFAQLPDWTGIWMVDDGFWDPTGLRNDASGVPLIFKNQPLSAAGQKALAERRKAQAAKGPDKECAFYFPFVMESPWPFEVVSTPEQTLFVFGGREIRHVYTDGRGHMPSDERWPTPWGDSIGHWDGATLVIETIEVDSKIGVTNPRSQFTERIRKVGKDRLEDVITMVDSSVLTRPFTVTLPYKRLTTVDRLIHGDCMQNDRNPVVNGEDSVTPPAPAAH